MDWKGRSWTWRRHVEIVNGDGEIGVAPSRPKCDHDCVEKMSDEEFAKLLQPVTMIDGEEYILEDMDVEKAVAIRNGTYKAPVDGGPAGKPLHPPTLPQGPAPGPLVVVGPDDRIPDIARQDRSIVTMAGNLNFNNSGGSCTAFLIGRSTALSAAHCFFQSLFNVGSITPAMNFGWLSAKGWAVGVTTYAGPPVNQTVAFQPPGAPCYFVTIPNGHIVTDDIYFDYAVMEFSTACGVFPGDTTGWHAWTAASDAHINGYGSQLLGYPASQLPGAYAATWPHPTLYEDFKGPGATFVFPFGFNSWAVYHVLDATGGNSGGPVELFYPDGPHAVAIHKGNPNSTINYARRIDANVISFVINNSAWPN